MKICQGFVSNSSTTSFTIYGWDASLLIKEILNNNPIFFNVFPDMQVEDDVMGYKLIDNLEQNFEEEFQSLSTCLNQEGHVIFGVGYDGMECDHYRDPQYGGHYFPEPSEEEKERLRKCAEVNQLPEPQLFRETFYD